MGKFSRTWQLMGASWRLLKQDKRLVVYPLLSGLVLALVIASFAVPIFATGAQTYLNAAKQHDANFYIGLFLFYFVNYFVLIFFNSALIACVLRQMEGGEPGLGYGLHFAWQRLPQIFGWALLTSSVGFILRLIEERVGFIGRIVVGLLGMAWSITSFLVVPVLVAEGKGPIEAYQQSVAMFKRTWGEQIIGNVSFGLVFLLLGIVPVAIAVLLSAIIVPVALVVILPLVVIYLIALALVQSTLQTIYQVAIYRYATDGKAPEGFDNQLIAESFRVKTKR
ncbi:MAG: hypothetical protein KGL13_04270 [Gammaproteobacteria bacterium]|nr:hypothetical protein [Gammaproteobacteria bacterium]MDE2345664.1 hypothetical protein [Gammaproteobacteria bacterium]